MTQAEIIKKWEKEADRLANDAYGFKDDHREMSERLYERAQTLVECANELRGLTY